MLAALDNNNSKTKLEQVEGENGKNSCNFNGPKHSQTFIVKKQCVPKDFLQKSNVMYMDLFDSKSKMLTISQSWCKSSVL